MGLHIQSSTGKDSKAQVIQYSTSIGALCREILNKKNGRNTLHFKVDASNTELLFQIPHSVNQPSIQGAVPNWCEQFGLTEKEKEQEQPKQSVPKDFLTCVKSQGVKLLVSLPNLASGSS